MTIVTEEAVVPKAVDAGDHPAEASPGLQNGGALRSLLHDPPAMLGGILLLGIILFALIAPHLADSNGFAVAGDTLAPPFAKGQPALGTDQAGRSILAGLISGALPTLLMGFGAGLLAIAVGVTIGTIGGYFGGWIDSILMRVTETTISIPGTIFILALLTIISPSSLNVTLVIGLLLWVGSARVVRAEVAKLRESEFVQAARVQGCSSVQIMLFDILPNVFPIVTVLATLAIATSMLTETGLAFLGATDQNVMTWGLMIGNNASIVQIAWWTVTFPGIAISLTVLSVNLLGNGLGRALNPRRDRI